MNDYTIVYSNAVSVPIGATFKIGYPIDITVPAVPANCYITIGITTYPMTCRSTSSPRYIYMEST